jgi:hypothetical protein
MPIVNRDSLVVLTRLLPLKMLLLAETLGRGALPERRQR